MKATTEAQILHHLAAYCSKFEHSVQEVQQKLNATPLPPEAAERILTYLKAEGFVNDERFARAFVNDHLHIHRWGRIKIAHALTDKGVSTNISQEALATIDETLYTGILYNLLKAKQRTIQTACNYRKNAQLCRYAYARGFEPEIITNTLKRIKEDEQTNT